MPSEYQCSECETRFQAEESATVVACPNCRTHLNIGENGSVEPQDGPDPGDSTPDFSMLMDADDEGESSGDPWNLTEAAHLAAAAVDNQAANSESSTGEPASAEPEVSPEINTADQPAESGPTESEPAPAENSEPEVEPAAAPILITEPADTPAIQTTTSATAGKNRRKEKKRSGPPVILLSYAFAVTLACAWLVYQLYFGKPHALESLPDLAPPKKAAEMQLIPENASMPRGHTLKLGESERYGNLLVKPVKVTREKLILPDAPASIQGSTVLKLWLEVKNASANQSFAPFDGQLLTSRSLDDSPESETVFRANQFVSRVDQKKRTGKRVLLFDFTPAELDQLGEVHGAAELKPGDKRLAALVTESAPDDLKGELLWRVHFRKGHNPKSGRGVTTLVEVRFHSKDIR